MSTQPKRPVGRQPTGRGRGAPQTVVRLPPDKHAALQARAEEAGKSRAALLIEAAQKVGLFKTPTPR
jgi:hypothetical protein